MSMIQHRKTLAMIRAYTAGRTSIYREGAENPYPKSEPELRAEYEKGVSDIPDSERDAAVKR